MSIIAADEAVTRLSSNPLIQRALSNTAAAEGTLDALLADPVQWALSGHTLTLHCAGPNGPVEHQIRVQDGELTLLNHDPAEHGEEAGLLYALGATVPQCIRLLRAADAYTREHGWFESHTLPFQNSRAVSALPYLIAAHRFAAADPTRTPPLLHLDPVLRKGIHPQTWALWRAAGMSPLDTARCHTHRVPLDVAALWRPLGKLDGQRLKFAAANVTPAMVEDLTERGLRDFEVNLWAPNLHEFTPAQVVELAQSTTHVPGTAAAAIRAVGYPAALAYGRLGLTDDPTDDGRFWWDVTGADVTAAQHWNDLGFYPGNVELLTATLTSSGAAVSALQWAQEWLRVGVRTMDELHGLATLGVRPRDVPACAVLVGPDGGVVARDRAARLWRVTADPVTALAEVLTEPATPASRCGVPTCHQPGCEEPTSVGHGDIWDGTPEVTTAYPISHPAAAPNRLTLIDLLITRLAAEKSSSLAVASGS